MRWIEKAVSWLTALIVGAAFWAAAMLFGLAQTYPYRPRTALGWLLFAIGIPLAWALSEAFGALLGREPAGQWVDRRTANKRFSWARVLYLLLRTLLLLAFIMLAIWLVVSYVPVLRGPVTRHFGRDV